MLLFINTNLKDKVYFIISDKNTEKTLYKEYDCNFLSSQNILSFLDNFISLTKYSKDVFFNSINALVIDNGPGINMNFRIGIIVTNTIAYLNNLNIIAIQKDDYNDVDEFIKIGWDKFNKKEFIKLIIPEYSIK